MANTKKFKIPRLNQKEISECFTKAKNSPKLRHAKILHKPGALFNMAFNFLLSGSYMRPHTHPSEEKVEEITILEGKIAVIFFDDKGNVTQTTILEIPGSKSIRVPAFTWHTYVILSDKATTYETMNGVYDPKTWKDFARWAPKEDAPESATYLKELKERFGRSFNQ